MKANNIEIVKRDKYFCLKIIDSSNIFIKVFSKDELKTLYLLIERELFSELPKPDKKKWNRKLFIKLAKAIQNNETDT